MENTSTGNTELYGGYNVFEKENNIDGCIEVLKAAVEQIEELKEQGSIIRIEKFEFFIKEPMLRNDLESIGYKFCVEVKNGI